MAKRQTRVDEMVRSVWGRSLIALLTAVAVVYAWRWAFSYFRDALQMEFLAWPVGIVFAVFGYLFVGLVFRQGGPKAAPTKLSRAALLSHTERMLNGLPSVQHRVHDIGVSGQEWPKAVVTATGVYIVSPVVLPGPLASNDKGEVFISGTPAHDVVFSEARRVRGSVHTLLTEQYGIDIPVYGVTVVDNSVFIPANLAGHASLNALRIVRIDELPETMSQGPAVAPEVAQIAYETLRRWRPAG